MPPDLASDRLLHALSRQIHPHLVTGTIAANRLSARATGHPDADRESAPWCVAEADGELRRTEDGLLEMANWRTADDSAERWLALRAMDEEHKQELLACCVARMLEPRTHPATPSVDELGIDWHEAYDPGRETLCRLTKAQLMAVAREQLPAEALDLRALGGMSKPDMFETLTSAFEHHREAHGRSPWIPAEIAGRHTAAES